MSWEQRNADFCKAQTDAEFVYIEAERRVAELEEQNAKLRELVRIVFGRLQAAEDATDMGWIDARLLDRMKELGVDDG